MITSKEDVNLNGKITTLYIKAMTAALVSNYLRLNVDRNSQGAYTYPSDLSVLPPILILFHIPRNAKTNMCSNSGVHNNLLIFIHYWVKVSMTEISLSPSLTFTM